VGIGLWIFFATSEVSVTNETKTETVTVEKVIEVDPIDKAKAELERINKELDEKEQTGLAEREKLVAENASSTAQLKAEYDAKIKELDSNHKQKLQVVDSNLERIREARSGF
jgi:hypothetical protein